MHTQDARRPMGAITTARMAGGTATAAISPLQRHKDYSVGTSTTRTAPRHELQALHRCGQASQAMRGIWIVMGMELAASKSHRRIIIVE